MWRSSRSKIPTAMRCMAGLCEHNPRHMHHAARYTSLGNDLEYDKGNPTYEKGARMQALALSGAPAACQPSWLSGARMDAAFYRLSSARVRALDDSQGFFLICAIIRRGPGQARVLIEAVTMGLTAVPGLADFNRRQIEICSIHSGGAPYEIINQVPAS